MQLCVLHCNENVLGINVGCRMSGVWCRVAEVEREKFKWKISYAMKLTYCNFPSMGMINSEQKGAVKKQ